MKTATKTIVLAGAMGCGKTTLGTHLARRLNRPFEDIDAQVATEAAMTIPEIFEKHGEQHFRQLEQRATLRALHAPELRVVALGGGAVMHDSVRCELRTRPDFLCSIWLRISAELAAERIEGQGGRPLWTAGGRDRWVSLLAERTPWYSECTHNVEVDGKSIAQLVEEVLNVC